jgi:hypothetical protein
MPTLTVGFGLGTATGGLAREFIQIGLQLAGGELRTSFDLLTAFPPICIPVIKDVLWSGIGLAEIGQFF